MAGKAEVAKKLTDMVKLVNTGEKAESFQFDSHVHEMGPGQTKVMSRETAMHGIEKTLIPIIVGEGKAQTKTYVSPLIIEELPEDKRSMEALAKSANDVVQLTGEVDTLQKTIAEQEETIKNLVADNANLKAKIKKLEK